MPAKCRLGGGTPQRHRPSVVVLADVIVLGLDLEWWEFSAVDGSSSCFSRVDDRQGLLLSKRLPSAMVRLVGLFGERHRFCGFCPGDAVWAGCFPGSRADWLAHQRDTRQEANEWAERVEFYQ